MAEVIGQRGRHLGRHLGFIENFNFRKIAATFLKLLEKLYQTVLLTLTPAVKQRRKFKKVDMNHSKNVRPSTTSHRNFDYV